MSTLGITALLIDKDCASSLVWEQMDHGGWANSDDEAFGLPAEILKRFRFVSDWFDVIEEDPDSTGDDWRIYFAYLTALAIDVKRAIGDGTSIFVRTAEGVRPVEGRYPGMLGASINPHD